MACGVSGFRSGDMLKESGILSYNYRVERGSVRAEERSREIAECMPGPDMDAALKGEKPMEQEEYRYWGEETRSRGTYRKQEPVKGELMSVAEMGRLLGLKKTDRYWLVHKNLFDTTIYLGKIWIIRESFEKWYAGQVKYRKVDGEEPGSELRKSSFSPRDIAQMLGLSETTVYEILNRERIETIEVDCRRRVPKEAFDKWYAGQNRYRTKKDRKRDEEAERESISMPEMAKLLGIPRKQVYGILKSPGYKELFETVVIAGQKRITKESFYRFLDSQEKYRLHAASEDPDALQEKSSRLFNFRQRKLLEGGSARCSGNAENLTVEEAALMAGVSRVTVNGWIRKGYLQAKRIGKAAWINREEFERWMQEPHSAKGTPEIKDNKD